MCRGLGSFVNTSSGEGIVALYAAPNPFLLNKICLNQCADDLAKAISDREGNEWFTARSFANKCLDDISIFKSTVDAFLLPLHTKFMKAF